MLPILVKDPDLIKAIKRNHDRKLSLWRKSGSQGLKPKLYVTSEEIITKGLRDYDPNEHYHPPSS